jgi:hypothetical protein
MSFEICALLNDALEIAKVKATHRLLVRPSLLMEDLLKLAQPPGGRVGFLAKWIGR